MQGKDPVLSLYLWTLISLSSMVSLLCLFLELCVKVSRFVFNSKSPAIQCPSLYHSKVKGKLSLTPVPVLVFMLPPCDTSK